MKNFAYFLVKCWITLGLFFYYRKRSFIGAENISANKPTIFLSNHQNALLDVLLIATASPRKLWFLTRSDVFRSPWLCSIFNFLQMLPVYRIRDGKASLAKNKSIFERCGKLLLEGQGILIFPEANHSLERRLRPLSKGFTRVVDTALGFDPKIDLQLVPIGQNYQFPTKVGDSAAVYVGKPIAVQEIVGVKDWQRVLKQRVTMAMQQLTTHISSDLSYEEYLGKLTRSKADFTYPILINEVVNQGTSKPKKRFRSGFKTLKLAFQLLNLPAVMIWRYVIRPKVPEPEFEGTFRFGFSLLWYSLCYPLCLLVVSLSIDKTIALLLVFGHTVLNLIFVKVGITSFDQRK